MNLLSVRLKLLVAVIILTCVVPGLSQRGFRPREEERFVQPAEGCEMRNNFLHQLFCAFLSPIDQVCCGRNQAFPSTTARTGFPFFLTDPETYTPVVIEPTTQNTTPRTTTQIPTAVPITAPIDGSTTESTDEPTVDSTTATTAAPTTTPTASPTTALTTASTTAPTTTTTVTQAPAPNTTVGISQRSDSYTGPDFQYGFCTPLKHCTPLFNKLLANPSNKTFVSFLKTSNQICGKAYAVVCCPSDDQAVPKQTEAPEPTVAPTATPTVTTTTTPITTPTTTPTTARTTTRKTAPTTTSVTQAPVPSTTVGIWEQSESCTGPDFLYGFCTPLKDCSPLFNKLLANPSDKTFVSFLQISNEICGKAYSVICCPSDDQTLSKQKNGIPKNSDEVPRKLPTMKDGCGEVRVNDLSVQVVGGVPSKIGDWPWIALLGYNDGISTSYKCGGALITSRHVLTAAHCIQSNLSSVRLGEYDLSTDTETSHVDMPVSKILKHPQYTRVDGHNDIAILYLERNVQFTPEISPICVPLSPELRTKSYVSTHPYVAGWGKTMENGESAVVLQELQIPVYNNSVCKYLYKRQNRLISEQQFDDAVLCAGELRGGKDTCQGDSGGPLMSPEIYGNSRRFHLIGIVSYGIGCARADAPGVYSRVTHFIEWIQEAVADTP